jgi:translation initiation factor IF-3
VTDNKRAVQDLLINKRTRFPQIRVIDVDGQQLGIMTPHEALKVAEERELDLVLVGDKAEPPVCRIMDYGKYKFDQEKKARIAKRKQQTSNLKEIKMRYTIEEHDYQVRLRQAERFLKNGDMVKAIINFRGREIQHGNLAQQLLDRLAKDLEEIGEIQQSPKQEGRNMTMIITQKR